MVFYWNAGARLKRKERSTKGNSRQGDSTTHEINSPAITHITHVRSLSLSPTPGEKLSELVIEHTRTPRQHPLEVLQDAVHRLGRATGHERQQRSLCPLVHLQRKRITKRHGRASAHDGKEGISSGACYIYIYITRTRACLG